jgi:hypothetical protein
VWWWWRGVAGTEEGRRVVDAVDVGAGAVAVAEGTSGMLELLRQQRSVRMMVMVMARATLELANNDESKDGYVLWRHRKIVVR